jgi:predicted secreted protein
MASAAIIAYNTILKKGDGATPEVFTDYGLEITALNGVGFSRTAIDATHMQSANGYAESVFGMKQQKPFTAEINWVPSAAGAIQTLLEGAQGNWQILFPDNSTVTFAAGINDYAVGALTPDGKLTATISFTPSGKPTWA